MLHEFPLLEELLTGQTGSRLMVWTPRITNPSQSIQGDKSIWLEVCDRSVRMAFGEDGKLQAGARFEFSSDAPLGQTPSRIAFDGPWLKDYINNSMPPAKKDIEILSRLVWMAQSSSANGKLEMDIDGEVLKDLRKHIAVEEFANERIQAIDDLAVKIFGATNIVSVKNANEENLFVFKKGPSI